MRREGTALLALGASNKFTLANVAAVSLGRANIDIDAAALEGMPVPKGPAGPEETVSATGVPLPPAESRAVIVARLVALLRGRTDEKRKVVEYPYVRKEVPEFLAQVLNAGLAPIFHTESIGGELAALVKSGAGTFHGPSGPVEALAALSEHGIKPITWITKGEAEVIKSGTFAITGPAALEAYAAGSLSNMVDAVAALSCEAFKAFTDPLDPKNFDPYRPHRGQVASASNLRLSLEGSNLTNKRTDATGMDPDAVRCIPQSWSPGLCGEGWHYRGTWKLMKKGNMRIIREQGPTLTHTMHGPAQDDVASSIKAIEKELNVAESDQMQGKPTSLGPYHPAQVLLNRETVQRALRLMEDASLGRIAALTGVKEAATEGATNPDRVTKTLARELSLSLTRLKEMSDAIAASNAMKEKKQGDKPGGEGAEELSSPTAANGGGAAPTTGMDADKLARLEAKRKEKADKAAAKAAAKAAKKEKGLILGVGSTQIRDRLLAASGAGICDAETMARAVDPYAVGGDSFSSFCSALFEKLSSGGAQRKPKIAKGTRDFGPFVKKDFDDDMSVREEAFTIIRSIFKRHGAKELDTPVFELRETLKGKYGEDSKLIYDLADQGGELLSLRYDLTVPFARYLAMYNPGNIKRYHIAKVYRRDNPAMNRGRFREFYQCDFDIAGTYPTMVPDAEVITVAAEILSSLPIGPFMIKLNHRRLLDSIFEIAGVPAEKFRTICSAVDKLDKEPWEAVKREMTEEKGLSPEVADRIGCFVQHRGTPRELHNKLMSEGVFGDHAGAAEAMAELAVLFSYLEALDSLQHISFDLSLARGLDYYTGVIYEAVITSEGCMVGSIAAGGRYDRLVGMFSASGQQTPCVGVSIGVERVLTLMEEKVKAERAGQRIAGDVEVLVATIGADRLPLRMRLAKSLWRAGIPAEYMAQDNLKLTKQMDYASEKNIPFLVIAGGEESKDGLLRVKLSKNFADRALQANANAALAQEPGDDTVTGKGALVKETEVADFLVRQGVRIVKWERRMTGTKAAENADMSA